MVKTAKEIINREKKTKKKKSEWENQKLKSKNRN